MGSLALAIGKPLNLIRTALHMIIAFKCVLTPIWPQSYFVISLVQQTFLLSRRYPVSSLLRGLYFQFPSHY